MRDFSSACTFELDAAGAILACSGDVSAIFGLPADRLPGTNFFHDVAPATAVPAFRGRFLDVVRRHCGIGEPFGFVLGMDAGSLDLTVMISEAGGDGRYRLHLDVRERLAPSRQREAMLTIDQRSRAEPVDPKVCEREPIHVPGAIQANGALLAVNPADLTVTAASRNAGDMLGAGAADALGRPLRSVLPVSFVATVRQGLASGRFAVTVPIRHPMMLGTPTRPFDVSIHLHDGRLLLEFEPAPDRAADFGGPSHSESRAGVARLRAARNLPWLVEAAANLVFEFTGYERVLVYRFDPEWNGEAIAEAIVPDWPESLLGLRFPASDIPRQARELYTRSPSRFVIDRDASPVPLVAADPSEDKSVDLGHSILRPLSPIHLEYQRNLGVNGSMSVAIMVDGRLWGLMIGHHRRPHYVAPDTRDAVALLVDALGIRIHELDVSARAEAQARHLEAQALLLEEMAGGDDFVTALLAGPVRLTDLFGSQGAAVVTGSIARTIGTAPGPEKVMRLADRLRSASPGAGHIATDHLASLVPEAAAYAEIASGLLAAFTDAGRERMLIWFRPEVTSVVVWSGDPTKTVLADSRSAAVLPRRSFERWVEERRGRSEPWTQWDVEVAETLARAVEGVALRQSRRFGELSLKQEQLIEALADKDRLIAQKDLLAREIDHRVKNSLQIVSAFLSMQGRRVSDPEAKQAFSETYGRVMSIARVHDSLYQAEDLQEVDLGQTIENLCRDLAGMGGEHRELELKAESGLMVPYRKAVALCLIATELVTNAWKYAYPDKPTGFVEVKVRRRDDGGVKLSVCDQGQGLPENWNSSSTKGLGMQLIRAMLSQIEGSMEVDSQNGTCFTVLA